MEPFIGDILCCLKWFNIYFSLHVLKYSPRDGVVDPTGFCTALTRAATRAGAKVIEDCVVTGIDTNTTLFGSRQVSAVHTQKGTIKTNCIINCTGYIGK